MPFRDWAAMDQLRGAAVLVLGLRMFTVWPDERSEAFAGAAVTVTLTLGSDEHASGSHFSPVRRGCLFYPVDLFRLSNDSV
ncbi:hypothetical protein ABEG18_06230 [Alsobacter sp. KACC 23698]|uniref:Uncharacterized protein n=1 Tax=Alsobacter sp. KACC 23698 TaxID=3149229 RepID=A0AAU7JJM6_9HYPH